MEWSADFYAQLAGDCPTCQEGRPDATPHAVRFFAGEASDAYLVRADIQRGLFFVVFRGRHVVEPTELTDAEAAAYGGDPRPGWPFPFPDPDPPAMPEDRLLRDVEALRAAV